MNTPTAISIDQALTFLKDALAHTKTRQFTVFAEPEGRVVLEPFDEDDAKPYYELSPEGEASLKRALEEEAQGLGKPLSALTL
jgi:hypothetical protein